MELYDIKATSAISSIVDDVIASHNNLSRSMAKKLVINSLIYNCVIEEILGQVDFMISKLEEEGEI